MSKDLIPPASVKAARREADLRTAGERQLLPDERVDYAGIHNKYHVAITDRRLVITRIGTFSGESSESIPLNAITRINTTVQKGKVGLVQLGIPGRASGELIFYGSDLGAVHAALIRSLPVLRSPADPVRETL